MSDALREAADRLYGLPAGEFVAERTRLARAARGAGGRDLAARIGALEKPTAAASLVNDVARHGGEDLDRLLALGAALRDAQRHGDRAALQRLTAERRTLLPEIVERAADRAARRPGAGVLDEAQRTLLAALASEAAADAVRSGRLVRGLDADGLEEADLARLVAAPATPVDDDDDDRARRDRAVAERRAEEAEARATEAEQSAARHEADVVDRRATVEEAQRRLDRAEAALRDAQDAAAAARQEADEARDAVG